MVRNRHLVQQILILLKMFTLTPKNIAHFWGTLRLGAGENLPLSGLYAALARLFRTSLDGQ